MREELTVAPKTKKKENLRQRAYLNSVTGFIDFAVIQITGFIVSPFIVNGLGSSMYGIWQMLGQITGYAKVADTRATQVLKWTVAKKKDIAEDEELRSDVSTALAVSLFIIPIVLIAGGVISWYAPYITKADEAYYKLIRITCSLLVLSLVVTKLFDLYESVLRGMNLAFKRMGLRAAIITVGGGLKVLVIYKGYGLIGLSLVQVLISLIIGISFYIVVKRNVNWFGFGKTNYSKVLQFSKTSSWYLADTGANILIGNSDKIILGFVAGPVIVAYYALTMFLPTAMQGLINRVVMGIVPGIGKLLGLEEHEKINKTLAKVNNITFLITTAAGVTIILFNQSFLAVWVGEGYYAGTIANTLIMAMVVQDTFIKHDAYIISATLDLKQKVILTLISGIVFILLGFILIKYYQIIGLCVSLIIGKLILFYGQRRILKSKLNNLSGAFSFKELQPFAVSLLMLGLAGYISPYLKQFNIYEMAGLVPVTFTVCLFIFYLLGLNKNAKKALLDILSSIKFLKSD